MKRKILTLTLAVALIVSLAVLLSGCVSSTDPTEGKNVVTFDVNGGILSYGTASTDSKINYAYYPGTYVKDPTEFNNYKISRIGYVFTGWYTSPDCKPNEKWDFNTPLTVERLTLYAGWEVAIKYTYSVNYVDGTDTVTLGSYSVSSGAKFNDWRKYANTRSGYTAYGYYSDPECTIPWDTDTTHPGGAADLDIPVYVNYIEGKWNIVSNYDELKSAVKSGNVYLVADIDCQGEELYVRGDFDMIFEGNGFKVSNFTVSKHGTDKYPACAIFEKLASGADVRNVSFENVTYNFVGISSHSSVQPQVAALTVELESGVKITNVCVSGTFNTDYNGDLPSVNSLYCSTDYEGDDLLSGVTDFIADIVVNKQ